MSSVNLSYEHNVEDVLDFEIDTDKPGGTFAVSVGALLMLAYFLSLVVSYLHIRTDSIVYPMARAPTGQYFCEYFILIRTSLRPESSFDRQLRGRIFIQLFGSFADSPVLLLKKGRGIQFFFARGATNIFVFHSPYDLGDIVSFKFEFINDAPYEIPFISWFPSFVSVLRPATKKHWGCQPEEKLFCHDKMAMTFDCTPGLRDSNGILKSLFLYHNWLSMMNSPVRFGMYSNIVNTIMVYFSPVMILSILELYQFVQDSRDAPQYLPEILKTPEVCVALTVVLVWITQLLLEALLRNTAPKSYCASLKLYDGLADVIESPFIGRDFLVEYDWEGVKPLIPRHGVVMAMGSSHGYAQSVFNIGKLHSVYNLWGIYTLEEQREWSIFTRSINAAALPLPPSMRWLAKETWSIKEEILVNQYERTHDSPVCLFCSWLRDWPAPYINEPQQAGVIFSNIICKDILTLIKMENRLTRARFARVCLFQWHGLLCFVFLYFILQEADRRNEATSAIKAFIRRTVDQFSNRNAREIQAKWELRKRHFQSVFKGKIRSVTSLPAGVLQIKDELELFAHHQPHYDYLTSKQDVTRNLLEDEWDDENMSAQPFVFTTCKIASSILKRIFPVMKKANTELKSRWSNDGSWDFDNFETDELIFEKNGDNCSGSGLFKAGTRRTNKKTNGSGDDALNVSNEAHEIEHQSPCRKMNVRMDCYDDIEPTGYYEVEECPERRKRKRFSGNLSGRKSSSGLHTGPSANQPCSSRTSVKESWKFDQNNCALEDLQQEKKDKDQIVKEKLEKKRRTNEPVQKVEGVTDEKKIVNKEVQDVDDLEDRKSCPISSFETVKLGCSYNKSVMPKENPSNPSMLLRHKDELSGYCCGTEKCELYLEIHKKVGHISLEIIRKQLLKLLHYAMDSRFNRLERSKCWLRKKLVTTTFESMVKKAQLFDDSMFRPTNEDKNSFVGFICNELMTSNLTILEVMLDVVDINRQVCKMLQAKEMADSLALNNPGDGQKKANLKGGKKDKTRPPRCLFCAKILKIETNAMTKGCYNMEKLVKFFTRDTIIVAEKEINLQFISKMTVQSYCAMIVNISKKELLMELEDPPLVLSTKMIRAMIYSLLDENLPKHKDLKDMSAEELRRMGTRRQRIQARHDPLSGNRLKESQEQKRRKALIQALVDEFSTKWRVNVKENTLVYSAELLAQCLVQERILGFSIYSGFISKEHEMLLDGSRSRLAEVEEKAYNTVIFIARKFLSPILTEILNSGNEVDVLFMKQKMEINYFVEAINVIQVSKVPSFLKTCCHYIEDIVTVKMEEFKEFRLYMKNLKPMRDLFLTPNLKLWNHRRRHNPWPLPLQFSAGDLWLSKERNPFQRNW
ncbi:uncharacterized protein LOC101848797 isoform X2 [Aplysia californica]|uniref:Uncharacterized protein LOC101848797 isoform X2 n=1 Tax=Aplysia californica TaxID=6500 RepID=A0ABM1W263_APLCA|nr:uncharacterized protein LOC101848797 isoform X2 [Aplysia californica]